MKTIHLGKMPVSQSKDFLRSFSNSENIEGLAKFFDKLGGKLTFKREKDEDMTLEKYLSLNWERRFVNLQIGREELNKKLINYFVQVEQYPHRFAWVQCPLTESNYRAVSLMFKQSFGRDLESV